MGVVTKKQTFLFARSKSAFQLLLFLTIFSLNDALFALYKTLKYKPLSAS